MSLLNGFSENPLRDDTPYRWPFKGTPGEAGGTGTEGVIFQLTANLASGTGATAAATVVVSKKAGVVATDAIVVRNTGFKKSYIGSYGHAIYVDDEYWISEIQQPSILNKIVFSSRTHSHTPASGWDNLTTYGDTQVAITASSFTPLYDWPNNAAPALTIENPFNLFAEVSDEGLVGYDTSLNSWILLEVYHQYARKIFFELKTDWPLGLHQFLVTTSGAVTAEAILPYPGESGELPTEFTLRDRFNNAHNAHSGDYGVAVYNYSTQHYDIVEISHWATRVFGTVRSDFSGTPGSFEVNIPTDGGYDGKDPSDGVGYLTVVNRYEQKSGTEDDPIEIVRHPTSGDWYPVQIRGNNFAKIFFTVDSAAIATSGPFTGKMVLQTSVVVAPCDDPDLSSAEVVDWSECLANAETPASLVGRDGWAYWGGVADSLADGASPGDKTPCHWVLDGLCCP